MSYFDRMAADADTIQRCIDAVYPDMDIDLDEGHRLKDYEVTVKVVLGVSAFNATDARDQAIDCLGENVFEFDIQNIEEVE